MVVEFYHRTCIASNLNSGNKITIIGKQNCSLYLMLNAHLN